MCNGEANLSTFAGVPGLVVETNMDVTLGSRNVLVRDWKVLNEGNSDDRLITFCLGGMNDLKGGFILRKANRELFHESLGNRITRPVNQGLGINEVIEDVTTSIVAAAEGAIPRASIKDRRVCW